MKLASIALVLTTASIAHADQALVQTAAPQKTLGIDAAVVVPVGDYGRVINVGVGALARLEVPLSTGGFLTGRLGFIAHQMDDGVGDMANLTFIPMYAGYRQPVGLGGAYIAGELGITVAYGSVNTQFGTASDTDSEIGFTLSAGLRKGSLDLRAGLFAPDLDDALGVMASIGYDFAAF